MGKRIIAMILVLTMFLSLAACGGKETGTENDKTGKDPANRETTGEQTEPETTADSGTGAAVIYKLVSFVSEGEEISGDLIERMGGGYVILNGDGAGMLALFGETFPFTYDDGVMNGAGEKMTYTLTDGGMELTMEDGTVFSLVVTDEKPDLSGNDWNEEPIETEPGNGPDLGSYDNPCDHPHEGTDLTAYNGTYRAMLPRGEDEETWLQVTGFNDYLVLEYWGLMEGGVYRYWAEEFWPGEGWYYSGADNTLRGKSQEFTAMAQYENYSGLPQNRGISLTEDGLQLDYGTDETEIFIRDERFALGHTPEEEMWKNLQQTSSAHRDFGYQYDSLDVVGTWGFWNGHVSSCLTFEEDGTFCLFWKTPGEPIEVYRGVYGFGRNSGNLEILAERVGYGNFPYWISWEWSVDEWGYLNVTDSANLVLDRQFGFWKVEEDFFCVLDADTALGYVLEEMHEEGTYTDRYDVEYSYYYSLPRFYHSDNPDLQRINKLITDFYYPIIETEQRAMEAGEFLSYDYVDWQAEAYNGVLFVHVFANTYGWEEHSVFYIDLETMEQLEAKEVLSRLGLDEEVFLNTVRTRAEEIFIEYFSDIPEEDRESFGYYDCLEETVSDEFVNLDLPIVADRYGDITVYMKISSMAGSGMVWIPERLFWAGEESGIG